MRLIGWFLLVAALTYGTYAGFAALSEYSQVSTVVGLAIESRPVKGRWVDRPRDIQQSVLQSARERGVPLGEGDVIVSDLDRVLKVRVRWSHPVLVVGGEPVIAIPLWVERSVATTAER